MYDKKRTILLRKWGGKPPHFLLIICLLAGAGGVYLTFSGHFITFQIFVIGGYLVDNAAVGQELYNTVCRCLYDLMVSGSKKENSRKFYHTVV